MNVTFETGGDGGTATTHDWLTPPEILEALGPFDHTSRSEMRAAFAYASEMCATKGYKIIEGAYQ